MYNINYAPEIATANAFIEEHRHDMKLRGFLRDRKDNLYRENHADRLKMTYDYIVEHYPGGTPELIAGIVEYVEK